MDFLGGMDVRVFFRFMVVNMTVLATWKAYIQNGLMKLISFPQWTRKNNIQEPARSCRDEIGALTRPEQSGTTETHYLVPQQSCGSGFWLLCRGICKISKHFRCIYDIFDVNEMRMQYLGRSFSYILDFTLQMVNGFSSVGKPHYKSCCQPMCKTMRHYSLSWLTESYA